MISKWIAQVRQVRRERNRLCELSDHMLRDIGVDRARARAEADRWPWDIDAR